jgi:hypothetical protein
MAQQRRGEQPPAEDQESERKETGGGRMPENEEL